MRQVVRYFFRADANTPQLDDRTHRHARVADCGLSAWVRNKIGMVYSSAHGHTIPPAKVSSTCGNDFAAIWRRNQSLNRATRFWRRTGDAKAERIGPCL